jgi:hypothetical protein
LSCYKYWEKIKEIAGSLKDYDGLKLREMPLDKVVPLLDAVEEIAHDQTIDFHSAKHILDDQVMNDALKTIRSFYVDFGVKIETENAREILKSDDPWHTLESFHFYNRYQGLIRNESQLVRFTPEQKFVFIGSGPLPLTLILFNKTFGVQGIGIEMLPDVAELSRKVIDKLGLSSQIEVIVEDDKTIAMGIEFTLTQEGFSTHVCYDFHKAKKSHSGQAFFADHPGCKPSGWKRL